ncbi:hypothetical protein CEXT_808111 [Caerostris extrusa]|uniref:Uncharacterized protein n=1 Tax=Caerostris extrusa TaxID=172846 RepID=A0AAV4WMW6_CAEEX|nr:hypothetical protein CEXT_808111 [Caerostris extrusa]
MEWARTQLEVSEELGIAQSVISRLRQRFQDDGQRVFQWNDCYLDPKVFCVDLNECYVDSKVFCVDLNELHVDPKVFCVDLNECHAYPKVFCVDLNKCYVDPKVFCVDLNKCYVDPKVFCVDLNERYADPKVFCGKFRITQHSHRRLLHRTHIPSSLFGTRRSNFWKYHFSYYLR